MALLIEDYFEIPMEKTYGKNAIKFCNQDHCTTYSSLSNFTLEGVQALHLNEFCHYSKQSSPNFSQSLANGRLEDSYLHK